MICKNCGKTVPDGAQVCTFCGAPLSEEHAPRHARPDSEPEELYSYSDRHISDDMDSTRVFDPGRDIDDSTRVFRPGEFDDREKAYRDAFDPNYDPNFAPGYDPAYDPAYDPENIGDSYENYQDGEDDDTFMDKVDHRLRRDDRNHPKKKRTWLWITLGVFAVVIALVLGFFAVSGNPFGGKNNAKPTSATAPVATAKPTQAPVTQAPAPTEPPATQAPAPTEPPATQPPAPTEPPATQPPAPTEPPATQPPEPTVEQAAESDVSALQPPAA